VQSTFHSLNAGESGVALRFPPHSKTLRDRERAGKRAASWSAATLRRFAHLPNACLSL